MAIDYGFKSEVLSLEFNNENLFTLFNKCKRSQFYTNQFNLDRKTSKLTLEDLNNIYGDKILKECERLSNSYYNRRKRIKKRMEFLVLNFPCLFLTMTFSPGTLENTTSDTRRQYVRRFLGQFSDLFICNQDFGSHKEYEDNYGIKQVGTAREHYHAVIAVGRIDLSKYKYGHIWYKKVRNHTNDIKRLSTYINKLTNHAIKESTKRSVVIYSKSDKWFNYDYFLKINYDDLPIYNFTKKQFEKIQLKMDI